MSAIPTAAGAAVRRPRVIDDYVDFCEGVKHLAGVDLLQYKRPQMERRLRAFAERNGAPVLADYLSLIRRDPEQLERFLDRMTINVSQLWRNPEQWKLIGDKLVPELAKTGRIRIWSAGCSYGAESHTIGALCLDVAHGARTTVLGTDIDRRMIERAREGFFTDDDARSAPPAALARWFDRVPEGWSAKTELRRALSFERGDLLTMRLAPASFDLVFCRNVVIYFTDDVRDRLHGRLAESLRAGGYLVIGSTERVSAPAELGLELVHPFIYRRL